MDIHKSTLRTSYDIFFGHCCLIAEAKGTFLLSFSIEDTAYLRMIFWDGYSQINFTNFLRYLFWPLLSYRRSKRGIFVIF